MFFAIITGRETYEMIRYGVSAELNKPSRLSVLNMAYFLR